MTPLGAVSHRLIFSNAVDVARRYKCLILHSHFHCTGPKIFLNICLWKYDYDIDLLYIGVLRLHMSAGTI